MQWGKLKLVPELRRQCQSLWGREVLYEGSDHWKEFTICVLQHIRNLEDLGGIAKFMGFTQDGINFIEEVGTQEATQAGKA